MAARAYERLLLSTLSQRQSSRFRHSKPSKAWHCVPPHTSRAARSAYQHANASGTFSEAGDFVRLPLLLTPKRRHGALLLSL